VGVALLAVIPAGGITQSTGGLALGASTVTAASCAPSTLNRSALLDGAVTVSPLPGSRDASARTQISFLGVPAGKLSGITVTGARSGPHPGRLEGYSQGDGASFLPSRPFRPGELVRVRASLEREGHLQPLSFSFEVAVPDTFGEPGGSSTPPNEPRDYQGFRSRPDLRPPTVTVTTRSAEASPGELLLAPYSGPGQYGPMILDESGSLLWFDPLTPAGARAADLRVQSYEGKPVLTWWQDPLVADGSSTAGIKIVNSAYQQVAVVRAGNGYQADLHEFQITPRGTALITVYDGINCDLSALGGPSHGAVADTLIQEIDLKTGLVRYEWHSLDHVALAASYVSARPGSLKEPFDFFHINAVDVMNDGDLLIDSRNTWAAYDVDPRTGQVRWRLGGKQSSFKLGPGAATAFQHDARQQPNGNITFFDNGATPKVHPQSRVIELALNMASMTATLVHRDEHAPALVAGSQGNLQALPDGDWVVGWGQAPYLSEFNPAGQILFDAHLPASYESYRTFRQPWTGLPLNPPAMAIGHAGARTVLYASWNGATTVASWRVLEGASPNAMAPVAASPRKGFETEISLPGTPTAGSYLSAEALSSSGAVLGAARVQRV
jgi:Arylsulfotransferase (ASST)